MKDEDAKVDCNEGVSGIETLKDEEQVDKVENEEETIPFPIDSNSSNHTFNHNDFVIRDGFPALRLPGNTGWNIHDAEPIPSYSFWVAPNLLKFRMEQEQELEQQQQQVESTSQQPQLEQQQPQQLEADVSNQAENSADATTTNQMVTKRKANDDTKKNTHFETNQSVFFDQLLMDSNVVFTARTRSNQAAYSIGTTYYCPCQMKPRCLLEKLVLYIYEQHTKHIPSGVIIPEQSGAEWWTLIMDHQQDEKNNKQQQQTSTGTKNSKGNTNDSDDDDDDNDDDDDVGMHFDADYGLEEQMSNLLLHPRLATITYLTSVGTPTLILQQRSPPQADETKQSLNGSIRNGYLSHPVRGKHVSFDGRLLHGAPSVFFPPANHHDNDSDNGSEDDHHDSTNIRPTKKIKGSSESQQPQHDVTNELLTTLRKKRVTLLVNIWINHCPLDAEPLDDDIIDLLNDPSNHIIHENTKMMTQNDHHKLIAFSFDDDDNNENSNTTDSIVDWTNLIKPITLPTVALNASNQLTAPSSLFDKNNDNKDDSDNDDEPAGEEEVVIGGRLVTISYGATMKAFHRASQIAALSSSPTTHKCIELEFDREVISLSVGEEVQDDDDSDSANEEEDDP